MPLSISKLRKFLEEKNLQINRFFTQDGYCFYIELLNLHSSDIFFLYIPSSYDIRVEQSENVYDMKSLDITNSENIADEYAGEIQEDDNNIIISNDKENIEEHLENNYKKPISIKDISEEDIKQLKTIYRQIKRLKNCVENINYKICITFKNYMCSIRRDNTIDFFTNKPRNSRGIYNRKECKQFFVVIDLETLYKKTTEFINDIQTVKNSIYNILERNQITHTYILDKLTNNKDNIYNIPDLIHKKKVKYDSLLDELYTMLSIMNKEKEKVKYNTENISNDHMQSLENDINRVHLKSRTEKEIIKIESIINEITKNINIIREKRENTLLNIDNIMFDNTVMYDSMIRNLSKLKDFC